MTDPEPPQVHQSLQMHDKLGYVVNVKRHAEPRPRLSRTESQAQTRTRLLDAAHAAFARRGYYEATVEDVVAEAGYSRGAFYANFTDKADLLFALIEQEREREFGHLSSQIEAAEQEGETLSAMYTWFTKSLSGPLERAFAELRLAAMDNPEHQRRLVENMRAIRAVTTDLIVGYCDRHGVELSIDPSAFALMVLATVGGFADQIRLDPDGVPTGSIAFALAALWEAVTSNGSSK
jgi:AcrR family transcriptional regulator